MFAVNPFHSLTSSALFSQTSLLDFISKDLTQRIKEMTIVMFERISEFFRTFNQPSHEGNLKAFALISCLCLITLLVISILRRRDSHTRLPLATET